MLTKEKLHEKGTLLRDAIFASDDGLVTTFAVVAGAYGASLSSSVVLILGFANLFADGISMSTGTYLGYKSEIEYESSEDKGAISHVSPLKNGIITYVAFILAGLVPLMPFIVARGNMFLESGVLVAVTLFAIGSIRSIFTHKQWFKSGLEMLLIGGLAAFVAFAVGLIIDRFVL